MAIMVETTRFGEVACDDDEVISFPDGLVGIDDIAEMVLLPVDPDGLFSWLQSLTDPALAFLAMTPWPVFADYEPELGEVEQRALGLDDAADAIVLCIVTSHDDPRRFTANLAAPVIINQRNRVGRQVVLAGEHPVRAELPAPEPVAG